MAKFTPDGWKMSPQGARRYHQEIGRIEGIIRRRVARYSLPSMSTDDLLQEARLAAAYAVDSYNEQRGSLNGYIGVVVGNALAMVACEQLTNGRQPYIQTQDPDGTWRKTPARAVELVDDISADPLPTPEQKMRAREAVADDELAVLDLDDELAARGFSPDARALLRVRTAPPPELWVMARNLNAGRYSINNAALAAHLGWGRQRVQLAAQEIKQKLGAAA